jgi:hypothetical protein
MRWRIHPILYAGLQAFDDKKKLIRSRVFPSLFLMFFSTAIRLKAQFIRKLCQQLGIQHAQDTTQKISHAAINNIPISDTRKLAQAFEVKTPRDQEITVAVKVKLISKILSQHSGYTLVAELARDSQGNVLYHPPTKKRQKRRPKKKHNRFLGDQLYELRPCPKIFSFYDMLRDPPSATDIEDNSTWLGPDDDEA